MALTGIREVIWGEGAFEPFGVPQEIASTGFPDGAEMFCKRCQKFARLSVGEVAEILFNGIPRCCGIHMQIEALTGLWA